MEIAKNIKIRNYSILLLFTISTTLIYSAYLGFASVFIFWILGLLIPVLYFQGTHKQHLKEALSLFILMYCVFTCYMFLTNFLFVKNPSTDFFMIKDSLRFWNQSNISIKKFSDFAGATKSRYVQEYPLFQVINLIINFFTSIIDTNNIVVLKLQCVFLGSLSIPFLYFICCKYFDRGKAYRYSRTFGLLSFVPIFSVVFCRDIHVYFLYVIGTYLIVYYKEQKRAFLKLFLITLLLLGFRIEHGLFFTLFLMVYFYLKFRKSIILIFGVFVFGTISFVFLSPIILNTLNKTTDSYEEMRNMGSGSSMARTLGKLPPGIKQFTLAVEGQIAPAIPFWRTWFGSKENIFYKNYINYGGYFTPMRFMESVGAIFWIYIWGFILAGVSHKVFRNYKNKTEIWLLFLCAILLLLLTTSDLNVRRVLCVYPIIYVVSMISFSNLTKRTKKSVFRNVTLIIIILHMLMIIR